MKIKILNALDAKGLLKELNAPSAKLQEAENFLKLKAPSKKSEAYRYYDTSFVDNDYNLYQPNEPIFNLGKELIIQNGALVGTPDGIEVEVKEFEDTDKEHFDPLYYLSHLITPKAIVVRVTKDIKFNINHVISQNNSLIAYRVVILVDANVHATITDSIVDTSNNSLILSGYDIFCARDASLKFITNRSYESYSNMINSNRYKVDSGARVDLYTFDFATTNTLTLFRSELHENANFEAKHLLYTKESAKAGTVSQIVHRGKNSKSNQNARNILDGTSRGIFDALIKVEPTGKYTIAHQNSKAILISDDAYMASKPQLEIYIDDLEASHGSTTGQLDKAQLFYLQSRGIKKEEAKKMLILGFANEIIDSIDDKEISDRVHISFESAYYGISKVECLQTCDSCL